MEKNLKNYSRFITLFFVLYFTTPTMAQVPSDLMENCNQWKITYPTGEEDKTLCNEPNNEFFYVNSAENAIVFYAPVRNDNGTTPNSDNIRSELRERTPNGNTDVYWTTEGTHFLYVKQAITHLPINTPHLVATQIHGDKSAGIDDSMVMRLENSHLFLSFNGGKLRSNVTIKNNYTLGTIHEVIFLVIDDKHYCFYSEDGNLLNAYRSGNASSYLVRDGNNDYVMDLNYDQSYFKVGNYTQSNPEKEGDDTDDPDNYGEVLVYDFSVQHGDDVVIEDVAVTGVSLSSSTTNLSLGATQTLSATVSPSNATNQSVSYSSSNTSVATVSSNGIVTTISEGNTTITVTTNEGEFTDSLSLSVTAPSIGDNLALNKPISGTGTADGTNVVANLVDGFTSTRWSVSGFPQTATIDLGAIYSLGSTELVCFSNRDYQYTVSVSNTENGTYTEIVDRSANTTSSTLTNPIIDNFASVEGRYVKITITDAASYTGSWVSLLEFRVFAGEEIPQDIAVTEISTTPETSSLEKGETLQISATISPSNATNQNVSYISSNTEIATVDFLSGVVTAIAEGNTTITATTYDGSFTDTTLVTVTDTDVIVDPTINLALNKPISGTGTADGTNVVSNLVDGLTSTRWSVSGFPQTAIVDLGAIYSLGSTELVCFSNRDYQYTVSVSSTANGTYTEIVDRSANTTSSTLTSPITDNFTSVEGRYVKITVTDAASYTGSWVSLLEFRVFAGEETPQDIAVTEISITPETSSLEKGETLQISATISPSNATNQNVSYISSNTEIATVDFLSGVVTAVAEGNTTITATTYDGSFTDTTLVTVTDTDVIIDPTINLALNKPISGTGTADGTNIVSNLVDSLTSTRWSVSGFPQTAIVDLGAIYNLGRTELVCFSNRDYQYTVSVSSTANGTYTEIVDRSANTTSSTLTSPITDNFASVEGRYVKITVTDAATYTGSWISLLEFRVFGTETTTPQDISVTEISITPEISSLEKGETLQISATISPSNATNQNISYISSDTSVATVDFLSGVVTAIAEGSTTITATTYDGSFTDTTIITVTDSDVNYDAPYDIHKLRDYLAQCKLQSPNSNTEATASAIIGGYSSNTFYVAEEDKVAFYQTGSSARTELRFLDNWYVNSINETFHTNVKIVEQTCEQLTFIQIHDDANQGVGNGPNKPLLRIYRSTTKTPVNHIWAAIKTDADGISTQHVDLGPTPSGYFDCDVSIEGGRMIIDVNGSEMVNKDVSYWTFPSYWKNGVYLQDDGEAITYFNELTLSSSSSRLALINEENTKEISLNQEKKVLSLWPNPATNTVNISGAENYATVTIYDQVGKLIINQPIQGSSIDISRLNSGLYNIIFSGKDGKSTSRRIIKN